MTPTSKPSKPYQAKNAVYDYMHPECGRHYTPAERMLALELADRMQADDTGALTAWPRIELLAFDASLSPRQVTRLLRELAGNGARAIFAKNVVAEVTRGGKRKYPPDKLRHGKPPDVYTLLWERIDPRLHPKRERRGRIVDPIATICL